MYYSVACSNDACYSSFSLMEHECMRNLIALYISSILYGVLGMLLESGYLSNKLSNKNLTQRRKNSEDLGLNINQDTELLGIEEEKETINNLSKMDEYPLIIKGISKTYKNDKIINKALKPTFLKIKPGEIFGLLGPNGAGKTTMISILTGINQSDQGDAWINGFSVLEDLPSIYTNLGVCPQFDLLWDDLTIEEHLDFYLRLKGSNFEPMKVQIKKAVETVNLTDHLKKKVSQLSGGMKRRLSLAIAIAGQAKVIFLDEPTTGLDPENRKEFWGILESIKKDKAIVLTTHIMKEADILSDRVGIIHKGELKCLGTVSQLKRKYGAGFLVSGVLFRQQDNEEKDYDDDDKNEDRNTYESYKKLYAEDWSPQFEDFLSNLVNQAIIKSFEKVRLFKYTFIYRVSLFFTILIDLCFGGRVISF